LLFTICFSVSCLAAEPAGAADIARSTQGYAIWPQNQKFVCNLGYTVVGCRWQRAIVQKMVVQYHREDLGDWTWVLVRAEDWKDLMRKLHLNPESPAFTALDLRETFLEESLITPKPERAKELMDEFRIPLDELLDLAVTHELGHAICHGGTEFMAEQFGKRLRAGLHPYCAELYP